MTIREAFEKKHNLPFCWPKLSLDPEDKDKKGDDTAGWLENNIGQGVLDKLFKELYHEMHLATVAVIENAKMHLEVASKTESKPRLFVVVETTYTNIIGEECFGELRIDFEMLLKKIEYSLFHYDAQSKTDEEIIIKLKQLQTCLIGFHELLGKKIRYRARVSHSER